MAPPPTESTARNEQPAAPARSQMTKMEWWILVGLATIAFVFLCCLILIHHPPALVIVLFIAATVSALVNNSDRGFRAPPPRASRLAQFVNARDSAGRTPLHLACERNDAALAKRLIDAGARIDVVDTYGHTPLHLAVCVRGKRAVAELLLKACEREAAADGQEST